MGPMPSFAGEVLIEAESFKDKGGWKVDQQFVHIMGSCYLLAHGLGNPVANAKTTVCFPEKGTYHLWLRTKNWVPGPWQAPGRFQVVINDETKDTVFGTKSGWTWQDGGNVEVESTQTTIELRDLTGFDGRCDALFFTSDKEFTPPGSLDAMRSWRDRLHGRPRSPASAGKFGVVIVGGGIAGCGAALAAEEQGLKVALIQDRPVLGGNASSEIRIHTLGIYGEGERILKSIDTGHWNNGCEKAIEDTRKRQAAIDKAEGITQFLCWRAYAANTKGSKIVSVDARHIETGQRRRFFAPVFIDCTGDGWIGYWAGAEYRYGRESCHQYGEGWEKYGDLWSPKKADKVTMGASIVWYSEKKDEPVGFPEVPWAVDVAAGHKALKGRWDWEYALAEKHQINDAEQIRDHLLRAVYGSFANAKKDEKNACMVLEWVPYIAGKRESRRLIGDYIYTQQDMLEGRMFEDTIAEEQRHIDVHYQLKCTGAEQDFLSRALFRETGKYYIPFRCLYSINIKNLMMAGRCFSCSHIGLGGPRIMRTTGQMGIATGYAARLCNKYSTTPRGVYTHHIKELRKLIGYQNSN